MIIICKLINLNAAIQQLDKFDIKVSLLHHIFVASGLENLNACALRLKESILVCKDFVLIFFLFSNLLFTLSSGSSYRIVHHVEQKLSSNKPAFK